jgi:hypothetical protein
MVVCFTSDNIRITTSPPHWFMPKTGGFSLARVPGLAPLSAGGGVLGVPSAALSNCLGCQEASAI